MITAPDNSWRYIGLPRTGSTLLHRILQEHGGVYSGHQHDVHVLYGAKMIVSCRNPYTRILSLWKHKRYAMSGRANAVTGATIPVREDEYPFENFIYALFYEKDNRDPFYHWTQSEWLHYMPCVHHLIHQETLWEDFYKAFPEIYGNHYICEKDRPGPENTSAAAKVGKSPFLDDKTVRIVRAWANEDFVRFGYPCDPPEELLH